MSAISVRLSKTLHESARDLAKEEDISLNQLITLALAEKISALKTESYFAERAERSSKKKFDRVLAKVSKRKPVKGDEW